jgi:hypothetical protein
MISNFAATIVQIIHALFVVWFVVTPFTNSEPMLVLHLITAPFLMLHWWLMSDECSLTLLEMKLRGIENCNQSFFWHIVSPIYKPRDADVRSVAWVLTIMLWLVTVFKVWKRPGMIKEVFGAGLIKPSTATDSVGSKSSAGAAPEKAVVSTPPALATQA